MTVTRHSGVPGSPHSARLGLVVVVSLLTVHRPAHAQSAAAEALFAKGKQLMKAGKIAQACDAFEASNRAQPGAGALLALGACREQNQQLASAWSAYRSAQDRAKDPQKVQRAQDALAKIEPRLSYLTISVAVEGRAPDLTILRNGALVDPGQWNVPLPMDGGDYHIEARVPGGESWETTVRVPIARGKLTVDVPRLAAPIKLDPARPAPPPAPWSLRRKLALASGVTSVAALGTGIALGIVALRKQSEVNALCPDPQAICRDFRRATELSASGHRFATGANVAYGIGAATAIAAVALWFTGARESPRDVVIVPEVSQDQVAVTAIARF